MARRPRIDRELAKYLVGGENIIVAVRRHWFSLMREGLLVGVTLTLAVYVDVNTTIGSGGQLLRNVTLLFFWASVAWLVWKILEWRHEWFVATDKRFLLFYGFIRRRVAMMPLLKVTDMTFDRSPLGRIIGYGSFILESAGQEQALSVVNFVPDADSHYRAICTQLFGPNSQMRFQPGLGGGWGGMPGGGGPSGFGPDGPGGSGGGPTGAGGPDVAPDPEGEEPGPAVVVGPGEGGVRVSRKGHPPMPEPESWYRSSNLDGPTRLGDTGEIPVVPVPRENTDEVPLYPPRGWVD